MLLVKVIILSLTLVLAIAGLEYIDSKASNKYIGLKLLILTTSVTVPYILFKEVLFW